MNLIGKKINKLTVISFSHVDRHGKRNYVCSCDCGKQTIKNASKLNTRKVKSCGCARGLDSKEATINKLIRDYKKAASKRKHKYSLSKLYFKQLILGDCFYCSSKPSNKAKGFREQDTVVYNGIDRLNSQNGYIKGNVVSCCKVCNFMKSTLTTKEFLTQVSKIATNRKVGNY